MQPRTAVTALQREHVFFVPLERVMVRLWAERASDGEEGYERWRSAFSDDEATITRDVQPVADEDVELVLPIPARPR